MKKNMTTRKKGILTTSSEWAKHLRPQMKRIFWSGERNEEINQIESEKEHIYIPTVEELLAEIKSWSLSKEEQYLYVAPSVTYNNVPLSLIHI